MTVWSGSRTLRAPRRGLSPSLADDSVLSARSARGHVCSLCRPDRAGAPLTTLDRTRKLARVDFANVKAEPLGAGGDQWPALSAANGIRRLFVVRLPPKAPDRGCKRSWAAGMIASVLTLFMDIEVPEIQTHL